MAVIALLAVAAGGTLAYFAITDDPTINTFLSGSVKADIVEEFDGNQKTAIKVANTGSADVYVRLRLVSYWRTADGDVAAAASPDLDLQTTADWVAIGEYYYYVRPLAGHSTTPNLLDAPIVMGEQDGLVQVVEVLADTVQAAPARAVKEVWGIDATDFIRE